MTTSWTVILEGDFSLHPWVDPRIGLATVVTSRASALGLDPYTRTPSNDAAVVAAGGRRAWVVSEAWLRAGSSTFCTLTVDVENEAGSLVLACSILADALERLGVATIDAATFDRRGGGHLRDIWTAPDSLWSELAAPSDATTALLRVSTGAGSRSSRDETWADVSSGVAWLTGSEWRDGEAQDGRTDGPDAGTEMRVVLPEWSLTVLAFLADLVTVAWPTGALRVSRDGTTR